jgi:hypothetical protein|tara:strand:+ start:204 stop:614 length:411 start_codon:yes stop_codon:yes gene_type:complete
MAGIALSLSLFLSVPTDVLRLVAVRLAALLWPIGRHRSPVCRALARRVAFYPKKRRFERDWPEAVPGKLGPSSPPSGASLANRGEEIGLEGSHVTFPGARIELPGGFGQTQRHQGSNHWKNRLDKPIRIDNESWVR